jgi:hypothetical protein
MAPEIWKGTTPGGLPLVVSREAGKRWSVTVAGAVRCRDRSLTAALSGAVGLEQKSLWIQHVASRVEGAVAAEGD